MLATHDDLKRECASAIDSELFFFGFLSDNGSYISNTSAGNLALIVIAALIILGLLAWLCY